MTLFDAGGVARALPRVAAAMPYHCHHFLKIFFESHFARIVAFYNFLECMQLYRPTRYSIFQLKPRSRGDIQPPKKHSKIWRRRRGVIQ